MISVVNLYKSFGKFDAVCDLNFEVQPGDVVGFLGPNGAGKSTTMKMLTGFLAPTKGEIKVGELDFQHHSRLIKQKIGYLPEGAPAYGEMSVFQFLHFVAETRGLKGEQKKQRIDIVTEQVELHSVLNIAIDNLSKGFKRRVGLAQAILHDPEILILDEPTDGLDPNQKQQVRELIQNLSKDKIVIISTHILEEVSAVCNRVMIIAQGKLLFDDTPEALLTKSKYCKAITMHLSYLTDVSTLEDIEGVDHIESDMASHCVTVFPEAGCDVLHAVHQHIEQYRLPVDTLFVEQGRLEEVFREMTQPEQIELQEGSL